MTPVRGVAVRTVVLVTLTALSTAVLMGTLVPEASAFSPRNAATPFTFTDNFDGDPPGQSPPHGWSQIGAGPSDWVVYGGRNGTLGADTLTSGINGVLQLDASSSWLDYDASAWVRLVAGSYGASLIARETTYGDYQCDLTAGKLSLAQRSIQTRNEWASEVVPVAWDGQTWYQLKIGLSGNTITCQVDNSTILTKTDQNSVERIGTFAMYSHGSGGFDDVAVNVTRVSDTSTAVPSASPSGVPSPVSSHGPTATPPAGSVVATTPPPVGSTALALGGPDSIYPGRGGGYAIRLNH